MSYILAVSVSAKYSNTEERLFTAFATVCILYLVFMLSAVRTVRPFLFILWVCGQRLYLLISSQQGEWISEISLLPHGEERSEPQDFELCSCFVLSLGNSLYSILILKSWAHALDLRSFYSRTKLKKWRHNKHTVFFLNKSLPSWKIGGFGDLRNEVRSGYGLMGYVSIL